MNSSAIPPQPASPQPPCLTVRLLGDFVLHQGDEPSTLVNTPRLQALLTYLLLHRQASQSRRHLAFLFWPDSTEAQALTNLRKQLLYLRQVLPDYNRLLAMDRQGVHWLPGAAIALLFRGRCGTNKWLASMAFGMIRRMTSAVSPGYGSTLIS